MRNSMACRAESPVITVLPLLLFCRQTAFPLSGCHTFATNAFLAVRVAALPFSVTRAHRFIQPKQRRGHDQCRQASDPSPDTRGFRRRRRVSDACREYPVTWDPCFPFQGQSMCCTQWSAVRPSACRSIHAFRHPCRLPVCHLCQDPFFDPRKCYLHHKPIHSSSLMLLCVGVRNVSLLLAFQSPD